LHSAAAAAILPHLVNWVGNVPVKLLQHVISSSLPRLQLSLNCSLLLLQLH
jgi:hypothetical protein